MTEYPEGYCPHDDQNNVVCPKCGNDVFVSYPQGISTKWDPVPWEYTCTKCKHIVCIKVKR